MYIVGGISMKVILSRKGMDSAAGGIASPILPDGTLLSLPIPDELSGKAYKDIYYKEHSFQDIIHQLSPRFDFNQKQTCHLDPDIYNDIVGRCAESDWKPAYGQHGIPAAHLDKFDVGIGDIFLFYGMFRQTEFSSADTLKYVRNAPIIHVIYGYLKVGTVLKDEHEINQRFYWHPHSVSNNFSYNRLYLPASYGTFLYDASLTLTKSGQNKRQLWSLPAFFADDDISISWQGNNNRPIFKNGYAELNASCRGQEFVITTSSSKAEQKLSKWVNDLVQQHTK